MTDVFRVEAMPAKKGDALLVEWGDAKRPKRMLIDAGTSSAYDTSIRDRLMELPVRHGCRRIDLLVISHIDNDHIEGVIRALCDDELRLAPRDVWFNGWKHLNPTTDLGGSEGEWLGALLERRPRRWNDAFGGKGIVVPAEPDPLPERTIAGLTLTVLTPSTLRLDRLRDRWEVSVRAAGGVPGDIDAAIAKLKDKGWLVDPDLGSTPDDSRTNGSSITLLVQYGERRALFAGDAFRDDLAAGLARYGRDKKIAGPVPLDLYKVSHHGSRGNIDAALLDAMACSRFLFSSNGDQHKHPNRPTVDLVIDTVSGAEVIFNYRTTWTEPFADENDQDDRGYSATYLDPFAPIDI
ncbi:MAG TPA: hypothetical protein VK507_00440 [Iamia sp.]|nr:hypothetical protein [Iamia sp.]